MSLQLPRIHYPERLTIEPRGDHLVATGHITSPASNQSIITLVTPNHVACDLVITWLDSAQRFLVIIENPRGHRVYTDIVPPITPHPNSLPPLSDASEDASAKGSCPCTRLPPIPMVPGL